MPLIVGDAAPAFTLPEGPGQMVDVGARYGAAPWSSSFPFAFSGVCTEVLPLPRLDDLERSRREGLRRLGRPRVRQCPVQGPGGLPFPLLSDFNKTVGAEWGVLHDDAFGRRA